MQSFLIRLLLCSVTMSALALFYMALMPLLAKRYSVTGCYYTWLVIVIGLIIPIRPQFHNAIFRMDIPSNKVMTVIPIGVKPHASDSVQSAVSSGLINISWWQIAALVWMMGMIVFLAFHVRKHYRFMKLTARWSEDIKDEQMLTQMQSLKAQMGINQNINLQFCDSIGSPMLVGFRKPGILLPNLEFAKEKLHFILKHELVHYKRKDLWYKSLILLATAVHWFNPIIYIMAKAIDLQCELSCDEEVIRAAGTDIRQNYSETIITIVKYESKRKTALSTNFYGGKKGMKERILSIMDRSKKKFGIAVLFGALILTFGTGFAFAAKTETKGYPEYIKEDIVISPELSYAYKFLPDPAIYAKYSPYGITISDDGEKLEYNGQRVRLFVDEKADTEAFFLDEAGVIDLNVIRNAAGNITGLKNISKEKAQEFRSAFFDDDLSTAANKQDATVRDKYDQYSAYGIAQSADGNMLQYNGQRVKQFVDQLSDGSFETFWTDEAGVINLLVERNSSGKITAIESISEEKAQEYQVEAEEYERNILNKLDETNLQDLLN